MLTRYQVTLVISGLAVVCTIIIGLICLDMGLDTSETACSVTYALCAVFWLILKSLVYLYFNEKVGFHLLLDLLIS